MRFGESCGFCGAKEVTKAGAKKLAVRAASGIVTGVTTKAIDEVKQCSTTNKKWSNYGKSLDENGKENGTTVSWITSAIVGGLGIASSHISSNLSQSITSDVVKSVTHVAVSGTTAVVSDATIQGVNIAVGNQDRYDIKRTITSASTSVILAAAQEGTKNAIYHANGGKDHMLKEKTNRKVVEENVPKKDQQALMKGIKNLKKTPQKILDNEAAKATTYTTETQAQRFHQSNIQKYQSQIRSELALKKVAIDTGNKLAIDEHQRNVDNLIRQKNEEINSLKDLKLTFKKNDLHKMNSDNAHFLIGDKLGQVAIDIKSSDATSRGATRVVLDRYVDDQGRTDFIFAGYTNEHQYSNIPNYGEGDYYEIHQNYENNLKVIDGEVNNLMYNQSIQHEQEKKKKKEKQL
ncbi:unnamed protein product [Rotaria sp. Silwood1]|nr:unnamed protein product [Rotaria sp. Silwood1]CAF5071551.1 unnamed protein product [Rotaria sp. Silwood1]